ncbi:MAG: M15 family metallopeptidase [Nocardioidaceae bacterium]|nr:M15 family metallopeptidase [Nocardioidaceae bacterium]NUS52777.1 M15 family metallopeptidase [Nocardioidaceae bacterium]
MGAALAVLLSALVLAGCSERGDTASEAGSGATGATGASGSPSRSGSTPTVSADASPSSDDPASYAVSDPGHLSGRLYTADVLLTSSHTLPASVRSKVMKVKGVQAALPLSLASLSANGRTLTIAAGDPAKLRRYTQFATARSDAVWKRVAGGEVAVDAELPRRLEQPRGYLRLGTSQDAPSVHIGAYAPLVRQISAIVNDKRATQLGMPHDNALLVSTGELTPSQISAQIRKAAGSGVTLQTLALEFNVDVPQTAVLSTSSVTDAVGTFSFTPHADGSVTPDPAWVSRYIRTEQVPLIGTVTCNKGMLPQLRGALTEIQQRGLSSAIHPGEYGGCYVPRYIAHDPAKGLSLHTWGIAVDLNVPGNQRGTVGEMNRQVVQIFKSWGFAWGGDWNYTDPMHFEMSQVVRQQ